MKKMLNYVFLSALTMIVMSCEKEIMHYKGNEGIYFGVRHGSPTANERLWPYQPFTNVDLIKAKGDIVQVSVKVDVTGPVKSYDRSFRVKINPDSTTAILGQHYENPQELWIVPAGASTATITVKIMRTPDLQQEAKKIGLRLVPTNDFALSFPKWDAIPALDGGNIVQKFDASLHTLIVNDVMVTPYVWYGSVQAGNRETGYFGVFTRKKMEFLTAYLGLTYEDFANSETMPMARAALVKEDASAILLARLNANNPVLEDDGRLMYFGSVPWTSYIGIPY